MSEQSVELPAGDSSSLSKDGKTKRKKKKKVKAGNNKETTESSTPITVIPDVPAKKKSKRPSDY